MKKNIYKHIFLSAEVVEEFVGGDGVEGGEVAGPGHQPLPHLLLQAVQANDPGKTLYNKEILQLY